MRVEALELSKAPEGAADAGEFAGEAPVVVEVEVEVLELLEAPEGAAEAGECVTVIQPERL